MMIIRISIGLYLAVATLLTGVVYGQEVVSEQHSPTLAERLGYSAEDKLLIVHADDIGFSNSANQATMEAFAVSPLRSGAIMVPAPWFPDFAALVPSIPDHDIGVHITLTSEWKYLKWDGVLPANEIPSLIADDGYLHGNGPEVVAHANAAEAEREARAQIDRAIAFGIEPTHLDVHNSALWGTPELFAAYLRLGREYRLPILMAKDGIATVSDEYKAMLMPSDILLDRVIMMPRDVPGEQWVAEYEKLLADVKPGVTQLIIHFGIDDEELRAITIDRPNPDAAWRQRDYDFFTSSRFMELLGQNHIRLITWREIQQLLP
jgi:predicted glycoside hydrolase/deacetylase ChbG (UPF0249 family)